MMIHYEVAGTDRGQTPVLLVAGAGTDGSRWPPSLLDRLVASGRQVAWFDHRDTGRTGNIGWPYDLGDLATDAAWVVSAAFERVVGCHVIGTSLGGMIGQLMAIEHPGLVASLTLIGSSPGPHAGCSHQDASYDEAVAELVFSGKSDEVVASQSSALLGGSRYDSIVEPPTDDARHLRAAEATEPWHDRLTDVSVPTLVIHGTDDPLFPFDHGQRLAELIPAAQLLAVAGLGHEAPAELYEEFWSQIEAHLDSAEHSAQDR